MAYFESAKLKQIVTIVAIGLLCLFLLISLSGFISTFLGAVIFYVFCAPAVRFLIKRFHFKKGLAIASVLVFSFLVVIIPIFTLTYILIAKVAIVFSGGHGFYYKIQEFNQYLISNYDVDILSPKTLTNLQGYATDFVSGLVGQTFNVLIQVIIMYFILYYLLATNRNIENTVDRFLPFKKENSKFFTKELISQTHSNVIGSPFLALIQGIAASLGFWIFGLKEPFFWGMMCGFLSFIPIVGSALIWIPAGIIQISTGYTWQGIAILIFGSLVIINIDNLFRMVYMKKFADVHPLVTIFGLIVGLKWFGLPGFIFGPLLISYLLIMIKIYKIEFGNSSLLLFEKPSTDKGGDTT